MHRTVLEAMRSVGNGVDFPRVPRLYGYFFGSDPMWWDANADFTAAARENNFETPCDTLCSERITPLLLPIRSALIENFCPERIQERARQGASNKDCLIRVYLGARESADSPRKIFFSLRNHKLHLNHMLDLGMDVKSFARAMAGALAVMHWQTRIDAKDVEFVLGSSPQPAIPELTSIEARQITRGMSLGPKPSAILDWHHRTVDLWLLDFNLCSSISMDDDGVAMAAKAWKINDPYYPRPLQPNRVDQELWKVFVCRYIEVSDEILQTTPGLAVLPRKFIASIIEIQRERQESVAS